MVKINQYNIKRFQFKMNRPGKPIDTTPNNLKINFDKAVGDLQPRCHQRLAIGA